MPEIICPYCEKEVEFEYSSFPSSASEVKYTECPECDETVALSWYAIFEARKTEPEEHQEKRILP